MRMLPTIQRHLTVSKAQGSSSSSSSCNAPSTVDSMGNEWRLVQSSSSSSSSSSEGRGGCCLVVNPGTFGLSSPENLSPVTVPVACPAVVAETDVLVPDAGGFLWLVGDHSLWRLDPRADDPFTGSTSVSRVEASFIEFDCATAGLPLGCTAITAARQLPKSGYAAVTVNNREYAVDINAGTCTVLPATQAEAAVVPATWVPASRLPFGNHDIHACALNGYMYVSGGLAPAGFPAQYRVFDELYSFDGSEWCLVSKMPQRRTFHGLAALAGELWICGGADGREGHSGGSDDRIPRDECFIFNPTTKRWRNGPRLKQARIECVSLTLGDRIYT
jgi:hypothetical protein